MTSPDKFSDCSATTFIRKPPKMYLNSSAIDVEH